MKFAQVFRESLRRECFPQEWLDSAIPYRHLKKVLKNVIRELDDLGLDKDTIASWTELALRYELDGKTAYASHFRPKLTIFVRLRDGVPVDASLSPSTKAFLERISTKSSDGARREHLGSSSDCSFLSSKPSNSQTSHNTNYTYEGNAIALLTGPQMIPYVEVPLVFDGEFFEILQTDVSNLDQIQEQGQEKLRKEISNLGRVLAETTLLSNGRKAKADLAKWRKIFELYLDARIFFSARERDHGARTSSQAWQQLRWFQDQVFERRLPQSLKIESSRQALGKFLEMNVSLLQALKFQEINRLAISKILKKFDKRTSLGVSKTFPVTVRSDRFLAGNIARDLCAHISTELVSTIPQLDDYLCPVCFAVAYWPVKLECQHVFCSRCLVKLSRKGERYCPLCRADCIMRAGLENFDSERAHFLKRYFPKEVKEKIKANELERHREIYGPDH